MEARQRKDDNVYTSVNIVNRQNTQRVRAQPLPEQKRTRLTYLQVTVYIPYPYPDTNPTLTLTPASIPSTTATVRLTAARQLFTAPDPNHN